MKKKGAPSDPAPVKQEAVEPAASPNIGLGKEGNELVDIFADNPNKKVVVSILFLDRSGSMRKHCVVECIPKNAVNSHLRQLKESDDGQEYLVAVISFAKDYRLDIPLGPVGPELERYYPDGLTLLYSTVYHGIDDLLAKYRRLTPEQQKATRVVIGALTDGDDNQSNKTKYPADLKRLAAEVTALGWTFLTFGIGINAQDLARRMGFMDDSDHAFTLTNESRSVVEAVDRFSGETRIAGEMKL